jgi:acetoin:2,6-dichlorophenolindophenol oxidoreductase subunit alpha
MIDHSTAKHLYKMLYYLRYVEDLISEEYRSGLMKCPVHFYTGQEAIASGIALNLTADDFVTSNHRSHGHYLAKGGDLKQLLAEIYCLPTGCTGGWGGSQHPYAPEVGILGTSAIVSGGIPFATGIAQALKWQGKNNISAVFFGDGATEEGNFYECLNYAATKELPVLFVCENNGLAVHSPLKNRRPTQVNLTKIAESLGVKSIQLDGNDAVSIYTSAKAITDEMRITPKPYFIEAVTYRWKGHVSPNEDHGARYRTPEDITRWKRLCPLESFAGNFLTHHNLDLNDIQLIQNETKLHVDAVLEAIKLEIASMAGTTVPVSPY